MQGYPVDDTGTLQTGTVTDIQIKTGNIPAQASSSLTFTANFDASDAAIDRTTVPFDATNSSSYTDSYTTTVYDSLGNEHSVCQYFTKTSDNTREVQYTFDGQQQTGVPATTLTFDPNTGKLTSPTTPQTIEFQTDAAAPIDLTVDYSTCTQYGSEFSVTTNAADGYASATQNGVQVDDDGKVYATYSNGERMLQGQVVLATFPNENGLEAVSGTAWVQTGESGTPLIGVPGSGTCGTLSSGVLESSNVDITSELVNLMTAQRNYQANTKVIATSTQLDDALFQGNVMDRLIYTALSGASQTLYEQQISANNLANVNTNGFRADMAMATNDKVKGGGFDTRYMAQEGASGVNDSTGVAEKTERPLDVAIQGSGYIAVQDKNGNEVYTRNGNIQQDDQGATDYRRQSGAGR